MTVLGVLVAAYVLLPIRAHDGRIEYDWDGTTADERREGRRAEIEAEVLRYRESLRAGTVCTRCGMANATASRFCSQCGSPLRNAQSEKTQPVPG